MANNHNQFIAFNDIIMVTETQKNTLRGNRETIRKKIRKYYKENYPDDVQPQFNMQGSFAMHTILNPIKDTDGSGAYDLDDGVYFLSDDESDRLSVDEFHKRIFDAIKGHTSTGEEDNDPCVTVLYADGHHVDLPIYFKSNTKDDHPQLAHKKNGWMDTDPKDFYIWFNGHEEHPQLRRIVRYLKAWCEYVRFEKDKKMPTGCILTMLAEKHYEADSRDDVALQKMLSSIYYELSSDDGFHCYRPTFPENEDLFENYSETKKNNFLTELRMFKNDAEKAINSKNPHDACVRWQKHFGNRFSCSMAEDVDEDASKQLFSGSVRENSQYA
jgi:hypothetical protein